MTHTHTHTCQQPWIIHSLYCTSFSLPCSQPPLPHGLFDIWPHALQGALHSWTHCGPHNLPPGWWGNWQPLQPLLWGPGVPLRMWWVTQEQHPWKCSNKPHILFETKKKLHGQYTPAEISNILQLMPDFVAPDGFLKDFTEMLGCFLYGNISSCFSLSD